MVHGRRWGAFGLIVLLAQAAGACDGGTGAEGSGEGSGGVSGAAADASAGSGGAAGTVGSSGNSGSTGSSGSAGLAGSSGSAGTAGSAGAADSGATDAAAGSGGSGGSGGAAGSGDAAALALSQVEYWAYQIQSLDGVGAVDPLVASHYDLVVLEPTRTDVGASDFDTLGMVTRLKASTGSDGLRRKLVVAYVDIGEAEDWRWYWTWSSSWPSGPKPADWPAYIVTKDPQGWAGNYPVAFWDPAWKDVIIYGQQQTPDANRNYDSVIDEAVVDGFDGIYLDWVEAFEDATVMAAAGSLDLASEMIAFIGEMRAHAQAMHPGFLIIQQNAASLATGHPELFGVIDALAQEAIWFDGDADVAWGGASGHDIVTDSALTSEYLQNLAVFQSAGLPVFDCEYAVSNASTAYARASAHGFVGHATRRSLSQLTTTPPPGY